MTQRAVLYARVSGDDRANEGRNLKGQLDMCREHAQQRGYTIVAELQEDDRGASGADLNLEQLGKVREMAQGGEFDVLVVREIDRFARSLAKQLIVETELKRAGVHIDYVLGDYPDSAEGRLNKHIKAVIAEYEREQIKARLTRGRFGKVKAGSVLVHGKNNAPYGYRVLELREEDKWRTFEVYEPEARVVRMIFQWCIAGDGEQGPMGLVAIASRLAKMGILTPKGARTWAKMTLYDMLRNTTYYGKWYYGKDSEDHDPVPLDVPPIVDKETWDQAQKQRARNRQRSPGPDGLKYHYLLRNFITCGHCQAAMLGHSYKYSTGRTSYYVCAAVRHHKAYARECDNKYYRVDQVDAAVWDKIKQWASDREQLEQEIRDFQAEKEHEIEPYRARLAVVDDLLGENQERLGRVIDLYVNGDFPKEMLTERQQRLEETIRALEQERGNLTTALESHAMTDEQIADILALTDKIRDGLVEIGDSFEAKRAAIEALHPQVRLSIENGRKVVWLSCAIGEDVIPLENESRRIP